MIRLNSCNAFLMIKEKADELGVLPLPVKIVSCNHTDSSNPNRMVIGGSVTHHYKLEVLLNSGYVITLESTEITSSASHGGKNLPTQVEELIERGVAGLLEYDESIKKGRDWLDQTVRHNGMTPEEVFIEKNSKK